MHSHSPTLTLSLTHTLTLTTLSHSGIACLINGLNTGYPADIRLTGGGGDGDGDEGDGGDGGGDGDGGDVKGDQYVCTHQCTF